MRGGAAGLWWILLCCLLSAYCFLIGKAPHLGAMWGIIALGVGWGMFVAVAVGVVGLVTLAVLVDTGLRLSRHEGTYWAFPKSKHCFKPLFDVH